MKIALLTAILAASAMSVQAQPIQLFEAMDNSIKVAKCLEASPKNKAYGKLVAAGGVTKDFEILKVQFVTTTRSVYIMQGVEKEVRVPDTWVNFVSCVEPTSN